MRTSLCLLLLAPLAAHCAPEAPAKAPAVAVFDFNSEWSVDYHVQITDAGKTFAIWVAHDLSLLEPITVVNQEAVAKLQSRRKLSISDSITPAEAMQVGAELGATTLVTGRMFRSGTEIIVAAKIVSAGTGEALGTAVKGDQKTPLADLVSQLSEQVGQIVLLQQGVKQSPWDMAKIVGTRKIVPTIIPNMPREDTAGVVSVDGRAIQGGPEQWTQEQTIRPGSASGRHIQLLRGQPPALSSRQVRRKAGSLVCGGIRRREPGQPPAMAGGRKDPPASGAPGRLPADGGQG